MLAERLKEIEGLALKSGAHSSLEQGACIMEVVSYVAGEPWSDHPTCACPILTTYAIAINDRFNDEDRQRLKPLIPLLVGTRIDDDAVKIARKRKIMFRNVTVTYPLWLYLIGATEHAAKVRAFTETLEGMAEAAAYLKENREAIKKIANANANANANASAYAYTYANAYADAYTYANAYADANANAYANADANAYANANASAKFKEKLKALRASIADTAVETLRLAILVK